MGSRRLSVASALALVALSCAPAKARPASRTAPRAAPPAATSPPARDPLTLGLAALRESRYAEAEKQLRAAARGAKRAAALAALGEVELETGRYAAALTTAQELERTGAKAAPAAAWLAGAALARQGKLVEAERALRRVEQVPEARRARLLLGEVLIEQGQRAAAEAPLMTLIEDYNDDRIGEDDAEGLTMVGRAAALLRAPQDANDAFDKAERAAGDASRVDLLLYRAELFLDKYDPGHAEEVLRDALKIAPQLAAAHVLMAEVKLAQAFDFDAAEAEANQALAVNPASVGAYFVKAGIRIRDEDLDGAEREIATGAQVNPRSLTLLSLRAAVRFLADDPAGFEAAKRAVLALNGEYSRMYVIIAEYADWEHRYDAIVSMMREAVRLAPDDAKALALLGLNSIRAGDEAGGLDALRRAFQKDPFNVRVYNTLNLYEKTIPREYLSQSGKHFTYRFRKDEALVLERYVPALLELEWQKLTKKYGFIPEHPVGVELYGERQNFAIRTDGLPTTAIQGVCFGRTLAAMSPAKETFNLGMTLWHEVSHVFHIQQSKAHVPRWFTEGLAEYETLTERPEWSRHMDLDLYRALRADRLPKVGAMTQAFTRAEELKDVAVAYYASSQILVMLVEKHGFEKLPKMLELWGQGKRTPEVIRATLGMSTGELDAEFREWVTARLARYGAQFVPRTRAAPTEQARAAALAAPKDADAQVGYALALLRDGKGPEAAEAIAKALVLDAKHPDALYLKARIASAKGDEAGAEALLRELVAASHDGYVLQMALAELAEARGDDRAMKAAFSAASRFDSSQSEPIEALADLARKGGDKDGELDALRRLVDLDGHDPRVYRRLMGLLIEKRLYAEAVLAGERGLWSGLEQLELHRLFGEALLGAGNLRRAVFELETAVLCKGDANAKGAVYRLLAVAYTRAKNPAGAARAAAEAKRLGG
ncbi:MAG: tetratricopeptide repeat protein [Sorangiineae bacterium]|nr:tetratricopeptide repeat protein [Polyangiaceae bacterium]MEB2321454.1 tetratricopeptide repeat protein [Sorangiineae bacterium]